MARPKSTLPRPLEERLLLPPHLKSADFLNPANLPHKHTYGRGLGGGIGANV